MNEPTERKELACGGAQSVDPIRTNESSGKLNAKVVLTVFKLMRNVSKVQVIFTIMLNWAITDRLNVQRQQCAVFFSNAQVGDERSAQ